jgi:hypothetical protein
MTARSLATMMLPAPSQMPEDVAAVTTVFGHGERSSGLVDAESYIMSKNKSILVRYRLK